MELFGKSAQDLNPLIAKGSQGFRELAVQAEKAGAVMSDQMLENLSSLQDSFDSWNMIIGGISKSLGALFAPALKEITAKAADAAVSFGNLIRKIVEGASGKEIKKAKEEFAALVRALADTIKEQMPLFLETGGNANQRTLFWNFTSFGSSFVSNSCFVGCNWYGNDRDQRCNEPCNSRLSNDF
jgi:hypothetical protein